MSVLVVCAVAQELAAFAPGANVDVVAVGVGPVEAAAGAARALAARRYACVVNAGIAGGFRGRSAVGDAICIAVERYVELGLEGGGELALPGGIALVDRCEADAALLRIAAQSAAGAAGAGITSATITTTDARAADLERRFAPHAESMEGFAVLRAAAAAGVPAIELRGISNLVGDRDRSGWNFRAGASAAVRALATFLTALEGRA